jgi:hypothetical protein
LDAEVLDNERNAKDQSLPLSLLLGTIANAKDWSITDSSIRSGDGSKPTFTEASISEPNDKAYGDR